MRLEKIELNGFKTFANRTEILFSENVTGIVGPNGSGKSNIGDAVRWVLGEQSAKQLRGSKMEDVIFNGTEKRKQASYCEVSLMFDNADRGLSSDYSEVNVTRRVYRSGDSEYYLNKAACRLKDIVDLFRDTGIGKEGYSIIGQGKIDDILSQKGEERRQVFEEAAGIMKYKARKIESERRLSNTTDNLSRVEDILGELEKRVEPLKQQAEMAREFLELSAKLKKLDSFLFRYKYDRNKEKLAEISEAAKGLSDSLADIQKELESSTQKREGIEAKISELEGLVSAARELLLQVNNEGKDIEAKQETDKVRYENLQETNMRIIAERELLNQKMAELKQQLSSVQGDETGKSGLIAEMQAEIDRIQEEYRNKQSEVEEAENALEQKKSGIINAINRRSQRENIKVRQTTMLSQMQARLDELAETLSDLKSQKESAESALDEAERHQAIVKSGVNTLREKVAAFDDESKALLVNMEERRSAISAKNGELQAAGSRLKMLSDMARDYEGYQFAVKRVLNYARDDSRVRGVVAQLIKVPKDLETALDMVLGGALQNIVTTDEHAAKDMINYLKENKSGRATFLPISSVRGRTLNMQERNLLKMSGCLGVASELVEFDEEYRGIFENLLGRTVVATDLNAGIPIMRAGNHQFRLVTLSGDVMHSGGSMSGGSNKSNTTNLLGREREIDETKDKIHVLQAEIANLQKRMKEAEERRAEVKNDRQEALENLRQEEIAVAREDEWVQNAVKSRADICTRLEAALGAERQLTDSIDQITKELEEIENDSQSGASDQETAQQEAQEMADKLRIIRKSAEATQEKLTAKRLELSELQAALQSIIKDQTRLGSEEGEAKRKLLSLSAQQEHLSIELKMLSDSQMQIARQKDDNAERLSKAQEDCSALEEKRRKKQSELSEATARNEELRALESDINGKLHRYELQTARLESDITTITERIWNEYGLTYETAEEFADAGDLSISAQEDKVKELRAAIRLMGPVNVSAMEEYTETKTRFEEMSAQQKDLRKAQDDLQQLIDKLTVQMKAQFSEQFKLLQGYFSETFTRLFGGGQAELQLQDDNEPLECGIDIIVQIPGKKRQMLSLLSGGERALTAIALLFAMLKLKPSPFCILDEIEAALDDANIDAFADYLYEYSKSTQFIVVTHRKGTMERCDALYGVSMQEKGVSSMVSVSLKDYE
ncbi:MAG: chromosome segregation protein SMC [Eubacteriales bacterium]|nr:chromosome segregation protein SMC [Eubacteriales bacterium]MDD3882168.1 chromosome segregation protein SMC [Eubacteriales bacterium]MDD4513788.1 chromosome segregation protein SMC [Eubacteriales bacterium]